MFFLKEVETPDLYINVMHTIIFIEVDIGQRCQVHQQEEYKSWAAMTEPLQGMI